VSATPGDAVEVLVIDDHAPFRDAARAVVAAAPGFAAVADAESGADGLAIAAALHPDLVLLDVNLGELDGVETCRLLKAQDPAGVVVLVSIDQSLLEEAGATCTADAVLRKQDFCPAALRALWATHGAAGRPVPAGS
jgi:DNA-binding NarL/FixJ family response regulator